MRQFDRDRERCCSDAGEYGAVRRQYEKQCEGQHQPPIEQRLGIGRDEGAAHVARPEADRAVPVVGNAPKQRRGEDRRDGSCAQHRRYLPEPAPPAPAGDREGEQTEQSQSDTAGTSMPGLARILIACSAERSMARSEPLARITPGISISESAFPHRALGPGGLPILCKRATMPEHTIPTVGHPGHQSGAIVNVQ